MEKKLKQHPSNLVKIVLFGPESTGKTTLSVQLSAHYKTACVPEFSRAYLQEKWDKTKKVCEIKDIIPIANGQMKLENKLAKEANKLLIFDTDLLETKVYSEAYYDGFVDKELEKYALENQYDLYLLTYIDTPWEADDLRDRPTQREEMFMAFKHALDKYKKPYILLKGDKKTRFHQAVKEIDQLLKK